MLQTKVAEVPEDVQSLAGRDVPVSALLYLSEDPGLDESASEEYRPHNSVKFSVEICQSIKKYTF